MPTDIINPETPNKFYRCLQQTINVGASYTWDLSVLLGAEADTIQIEAFFSDINVYLNDAANDAIPLVADSSRFFPKKSLGVDWIKATNTGSTQALVVIIVTA